MSDDFSWQQDPSARRKSATRVAVVLACASVGIAAGAYYPIKTVISAFERAGPPRVVSKESVASQTPQDHRKSSFEAAANNPARPSTEHVQAPPQSAGRFVLLNPGSVEPPPGTEEQPKRTRWSQSPSFDQKVAPRRHLAKGPRVGDRNVLVVVRRRGPPYDTKVLRGRIENGQLIVRAPGIALR